MVYIVETEPLDMIRIHPFWGKNKTGCSLNDLAAGFITQWVRSGRQKHLGAVVANNNTSSQSIFLRFIIVP